MKNNLKELRTQAGMTQEALASAIGTSKSYISQLENGARNIETIRQSTMDRLCAALNCSAKDLLMPDVFHYDEDGRLIVDSVWHDPQYPTGYVVFIGDSVFLLPMGRAFRKGTEAEEALVPLRFYQKSDKYRRKIQNYEYPLIACIPKDGIPVKLGRAITSDEFADLVAEYGLTEDDISDTFKDTKGKIYGRRNEKEYTCIQVQVDVKKAIELEGKLQKMGIEAMSGAPRRVNIRVEALQKTVYAVEQSTVEIPWEERASISSLCSSTINDTDPIVLGKCEFLGEALRMAEQYLPEARDMRTANGKTIIRLTETYVEIYTEDKEGEFISGSDFDSPWEFHWDDANGLVVEK